MQRRAGKPLALDGLLQSWYCNETKVQEASDTKTHKPYRYDGFNLQPEL